MSYEFLTVIGAIIGVLLAVNGYFFKELVDSSNQIKLQLSILITKHDNTESITKMNAADIVNLREKLHNLEAKIINLNQVVKNLDKN
jgi:hypothetical protein